MSSLAFFRPRKPAPVTFRAIGPFLVGHLRGHVIRALAMTKLVMERQVICPINPALEVRANRGHSLVRAMHYYLITVIRSGASVGEFVIQAPRSNAPQLLKRLNGDDNGQICYHLHLTSRFKPDLPPDVSFHLDVSPPLADIGERRQTFTSSQGHKIWIIPAATG